MNDGIRHIIEKEFRLSLIDISKSDSKKAFDMIGDLSISIDPKINKRVLYYTSTDIPYNVKKMYNFAFKIPDNEDVLVFFYKADYLYIHITKYWNTKDGVVIRKFLERASFDLRMKCNICENSYEHMINCKKCGTPICEKCKSNIEQCSGRTDIKCKCPYCRGYLY